MKTTQPLLTLSCALAFAACLSAEGAPLVYSENNAGEISTDGAAPTLLNFSAGMNCVSGTMGRGAVTAGVVDADIFTFSIDPTFVIDSIQLKTYTAAGSTGQGSFLAIAAGSTIKMDGGATHLSNMLVGQTGELLGILSTAKRFSGGGASSATTSSLSSPIGEGTYTLWFQEAGQNKVDYELCFNMTAVPEPSLFGLLSLGLAGVLLRRKRE